MNLYNIFKVLFGGMLIISVQHGANAFIGRPKTLNKSKTPMKNKLLLPLKIKKPDSFTELKQPPNNFERKIEGLIKLVRPKSILPTTFLIFSGGWIMNPSFYNLLHSKTFLCSSVCTLLTLMSSMVINDIYDVNVDKINNPERPIPSGQVKIYEAIILNIFLIGSAEYLSVRHLPENLQFLLNFVIIVLGIYTSILKRIPVIKNISCATIVSLTLFFSGVASNGPKLLLIENRNLGLLSILMSFVFYGSLSNEILLDIRDYDGDKENNIYTVPVIIGKDAAFIIASIITNINVISTSMSLAYSNNIISGIIMSLICTPYSFKMFKLRNKKKSIVDVIKIVNETTGNLFFITLYMCLLAFF